MRDVLRHEDAYSSPFGDLAESREKRGAPRFTLLIRAAKLIATDGEYLCVVRDASETGINIRTFHDLPESGSMLLELQNGDRHELELVWQEEDRAGLRFHHSVDIARIVESPSRFTKRPIRINVEHPATLTGGLQCAKAMIHDISQQGAKVSCDHRFSIDQRVKLEAEGIPEVNTKIRWRRDNTYGLVFEDTFQFGDLARIIAGLHQQNQH